MDKTENYLQVLADSLDKKTIIMEELLKITLAQKEIANAEAFDDEAFEKSIEKKAELVEKLTMLDNGFQTLYNNIKNQIENHKEQYREEIKSLQSKLKVIMDYNMRLQVEEESNRKLIASRFATLKKEAVQIKKNQAVAANYYKTMNNISTEPYFMDHKK